MITLPIASNLRMLGLVVLLFPSLSAYAHIYIGATIEASSATLGSSSPQIAYSSGATITDAYPLSHNRTSAAVGGLNAGYEFSGLNWKPSVALGLGIYTNLSNYQYDGQVIETAAGDVSSLLYDYRYGISSTRLMADIQVAWMLGRFSPFINLGVGSAWNKMQDYRETAVTSVGYPPLPPFQPHTTANFAYQAGVGVSTVFHFTETQVNFSQDRLSLGYRYVNLGSTSFGTRGIDYPYQLTTGALQTNNVYLSYTHLF